MTLEKPRINRQRAIYITLTDKSEKPTRSRSFPVYGGSLDEAFEQVRNAFAAGKPSRKTRPEQA